MLSRCPHCFSHLLPEYYAFRCTSTNCAETPDLALSVHRGSEELARPVVDVDVPPQAPPPRSATCSVCQVPTSHEICPQCHYSLPPNWRSCATTCLAMAGARASGKSIYIGVLVKQAEAWCEQHGEALVPLDTRTEEVYKRVYETPLYEKRGLIAPTPSAQARLAPQREPLMFRMGQVQGRPHVLVLRDVAGEDLESPGTVPGPFRFFARADLVVFLFDPLRLEDVRGQLEGVVAPVQLEGGDPQAVLQNLVRLMRGGEPFGAPLATPLALVLAKFDTLAELADVQGGPYASVMGNLGATFSLDPSDEFHVDRGDADRLDAEVRSLLVRLQARGLLNLVDKDFLERRLFAVSALGALPFDSTTVSPRGIAPFRVLDPLKYALARTGAIPTK